MDFLDITLGLRKKYQITVPKEAYPKFETLNGAVEYLLKTYPNDRF